MSDARRIVIVGAGLAGFGLLQALREGGSTDHIVLIGEEAGLPYDRPPLSKDVLQSGEVTAAIDLCTADALAALNAELVQAEVVAIDRPAKALRLDDGTLLSYDRLVLATGGDARPLAGFEADGERVFTLRNRDDALGLARVLRQANSLLIVGAGWVGLEVASVARGLGLKVTVADTAERVCARVLPPDVSAWLEARHRSAGVEFQLGSRGSVQRDGDVFSLEGGEPHDLLLSAIGILPRDGLALDAGLACDGGIVTDACGRTSDDHIFAIGDVAKAWQPALGQHVVRQSWKAALLDARLVAATLLDQPLPAREAPWFWSEQCDHMIQAAGWPMAGDELLSVDGTDKPLWKFGRDGQVHFAVGIDRNRDVRMAHRQLGQAWASADLVGESK
jgi:3-phenylpropionate/trans-cinnamate dioxygenase ferredoxin reductase subunit